MNSYELISEIYGLLARVDATVLIEARARSDSRAVAAVLDALALGVEPESSYNHERAIEEALAPDSASEVSILLSHVRTTDELARLAKRIGVRVTRNAKDSRARLAARIARAIDALDERRKKKAQRDLRRYLEIDETAGWINVIRSDRKK